MLKKNASVTTYSVGKAVGNSFIQRWWNCKTGKTPYGGEFGNISQNYICP